MNRLLPRLGRREADAVYDRLAPLGVTGVARLMPAEDLPFTYSPVGGVRAEVTFMRELRNAVLELATAAGYPDRRSQADLRTFDVECALLLHERLSITPHEAGHREVWAGLTSGYLFDIAAWRWDGVGDRRRTNGDVNRDTFRRLWWRAELLQDPELPWDGFAGLGEDELVAITERPVVTGNPIVAQSIVRQFRAHLDANPTLASRRMLIMRDAMKRLTRLTPFLSLDVLAAEQIDRTVGGVMGDAVSALAAALDSEVSRP